MAAQLNPRPAPARPGRQWWRPITVCAIVISLCIASPLHAQENAPQIFGPAVDWSLAGQFKLGLEGDINRRLESNNQRTSLTLDFDGGLTLEAQTKRSEISLDLGVQRFFFLGENQPSNDNTQQLDPRFALSGNYRGKTYTVSGDFGFDFRPTSFTQTDDTGITDADTTQLTISYDNSLSLELSRLNQLIFSTNFQAVDFTDPAPGLVATRTFGGSVAWQHQVSETTTLTLSSGGRFFRAQNLQETKSQTFDFSLGLEHQRTRRHTFGLDIGLTTIRTVALNSVGIRETDLTLGVTGGASFEYALKSLSIGIGLTQSVDPSATGELQSFTRLNSTADYTINDQEQIGLNVNYTLRTPVSGDGGTFQAFNVGPNYSLDLTEQATLSAGYLFRMSQGSTGGLNTGQRIFLTLTQNFDVLP